MFVGHYGVGLILKKADRRLNLGWLFLAVILPDILVALFLLLGIERIIIPVDYQKLHYMMYDFPYSHGLAATIGWTILIIFLVKAFWTQTEPGRNKVAVILAAAFFSHFILDVIVHVPEIPLVGMNSYKIGLGLWNNFPVAVTLEISLALIGIAMYIKTSGDKRFRAKVGIACLILLLSILTVGPAFMPAPQPSMLPIMAIQLIVTNITVSLLAFWLDRDNTGIKKAGEQHPPKQEDFLTR